MKKKRQQMYAGVAKGVDRGLIALGLFLMLGAVLLGTDFRDTVGSIVGGVLSPLTAMLPMDMVIFVLAVITGLYSSLIQKYTMDWTLMHRIQDKMRKFQREYMEAQKAGNKQKLAKLEQERAQMMAEQWQIMRQQFKPMMYITVVTLPIFYWLYLQVNAAPYTMVLPVLGERSLSQGIMGFLQYWIVWYVLCSLMISQVIRKAIDVGGR
ncbi:MAG: hypothetical protein PWP01_181 [Methanosarcinales archaeon]|nr:hypothetical protein [Methanosarcinales archaeon]